MKITTSALLLSLAMFMAPLGAKDLPVVPRPKLVELCPKAAPFLLADAYTISASKDLQPAVHLFLQDVEDLYGLKGHVVDAGNAAIQLMLVEGMKEETYQIEVSDKGVQIKAANYPSLVLGLTTCMQMMKKGDAISIPCGTIVDTPSFDFRCYMLDVARQWVEVETVKQIIDLCRWYKVRYMQMHLTDDQLFTFESKHYPQLTEGKAHYTQEQLRELVEYAKQRGIIIIPEFDVPGHSSAMRRQMPEIFGAANLGMIDVIKPECMDAVKKITREMMDVFYTSPYFHIGADEVWLGGYQKQEHVKKFLQDNPDKADEVHDLYLSFIVEMHEFVKSQGKTTLAWESFKGNGSDKVKIPQDLIIEVFGTVRALPHEVIASGYNVINSTFKPWYMTPGTRWSAESIYNSDARHWENFHDKAPSYHTPFQLPSNNSILGAQMCSWEMADFDQLLSAHDRIAAFSESAWNDDVKQSYAQYKKRADKADAMVMDLIFPAKADLKGFKSEDPNGVNHNLINTFAHEASVFYKPFCPTDTIRYTTNRSLPTQESPELVEPLKLTKNTVVKYMMFDKEGQVRGYKSVPYTYNAIDATFTGDLLPLRDHFFNGKRAKVNFCDNVTVTLTTGTPDTKIYYSTDGKQANKQSTLYTGPVTFDETVDFWAAVFTDKGKKCGDIHRQLVKKDRNAPVD